MIVKISKVSKEGAGNLIDDPKYDVDEARTVREQPGCIGLKQFDVKHSVFGVGVLDMTGIIGVDAEGNMEEDDHLVALPCPPHCSGKEQQGFSILSFDEITEKSPARENLWQSFLSMLERLFRKTK